MKVYLKIVNIDNESIIPLKATKEGAITYLTEHEFRLWLSLKELAAADWNAEIQTWTTLAAGKLAWTTLAAEIQTWTTLAAGTDLNYFSSRNWLELL